MISFARVETREFDERKIFNSVVDYLHDEEVEFSDFNYEILSNLPEDVQRIIFAKVGAMLIDYSRSKDF